MSVIKTKIWFRSLLKREKVIKPGTYTAKILAVNVTITEDQKHEIELDLEIED